MGKQQSKTFAISGVHRKRRLPKIFGDGLNSFPAKKIFVCISTLFSRGKKHEIVKEKF